MAAPEMVVLGASAGGLNALSKLLALLPESFGLPVALVQHLMPGRRSVLAKLLQNQTELRVCQAMDKARMIPGTVYVAPPDYHLGIDRSDGHARPPQTAGSFRFLAPHAHYQLALSQEEPVLFSRPSIDVLFESAAIATRGRLVGALLTGANADGAYGCRCIKRWGGAVMVQAPETAEVATMPRAALDMVEADVVGDLEHLASELRHL